MVFEVLFFVARFFCVLAAGIPSVGGVVLYLLRLHGLRDGAVVLMLVALRGATEAAGLLLTVAFDLAICFAGRFTGTVRSPEELSSCLYYSSI